MGFFDGVHIGHAALLEKAKERAKEIGAKPAVLSFDTHPDKLVFRTEIRLLSDTKERESIIRRCFGIEDTVFIHFDRETMNLPWQEFADRIIRSLGAKWFVVGHDFTFGRKGEGTAEKLKAYCAERGIGCDIIRPVCLDGRIVSSTYIRTLIERGEMPEAARYLGRPFSLTGSVRSGSHLGRTLGAPTINMYFPPESVVPKLGVYAAKAVLPGEDEHIAVTNVGVRPTVSEEGEVSVETYLLDYEGDLYGVPVRVEFYRYLRPEIRFDTVEELSIQIRKDGDAARAFFREKKEGQ